MSLPAIQTILCEVIDALAGRVTFYRQLDAQLRAVTSERRLELPSLRYQTGFDYDLNLLDPQHQFYVALSFAIINLRVSESIGQRNLTAGMNVRYVPICFEHSDSYQFLRGVIS